MMAHLWAQWQLLGPHTKRHWLPVCCRACSGPVLSRPALECAKEDIVGIDSVEDRSCDATLESLIIIHAEVENTVAHVSSHCRNTNYGLKQLRESRDFL